MNRARICIPLALSLIATGCTSARQSGSIITQSSYGNSATFSGKADKSEYVVFTVHYPGIRPHHVVVAFDVEGGWSPNQIADQLALEWVTSFEDAYPIDRPPGTTETVRFLPTPSGYVPNNMSLLIARNGANSGRFERRYLPNGKGQPVQRVDLFDCPSACVAKVHNEDH